MRHALLGVIAALTLIGCQPAGLPLPALSASDGWVREPLPGRDMTAGYVSLSNNSDSELVIDRITSPQYGRIEIHTTIQQDGALAMRAIDALRLAPGTGVTLEPGGTHLMLMAPTATPSAGGRIELTLYSGDRPLVELSLPLTRTAPNAQ